MSDFANVTLLDSLGPVQLTVFVIASFVVLAATFAIIRFPRRRGSISAALALFGIAIFFYAGSIEHIVFANYHEMKISVGGSDPAAFERGLARFYTKLHAFRSLSVVTLLIGAVGVVATRSADVAK